MAASLLGVSASAQSAKEIVGASPCVAIEKESAPKLTVDRTPLATGLALGIVWIQYGVENVHIVPVFWGRRTQHIRP